MTSHETVIANTLPLLTEEELAKLMEQYYQLSIPELVHFSEYKFEEAKDEAVLTKFRKELQAKVARSCTHCGSEDLLGCTVEKLLRPSFPGHVEITCRSCHIGDSTPKQLVEKASPQAPPEEERKYYLCNGCPKSYGECSLAWDEYNKEPEVQGKWTDMVLWFCLNK